jgi:hypothetical protein
MTKYTIFAKWPHGAECWFPPYGRGDEGRTLDERIEYVRNYGEGFTPIAWAVLSAQESDDRHLKDELAAAIAAGRLIDCIDGRYIPRGVPESIPQTCDDILRSMGYPVGEKAFCDALARDAAADMDMDLARPPLDWAASKAFDAFKGFFVGGSSQSGEMCMSPRPLSIFPAVDIHPVSPVIFDGAGRAVKVK